MAPRPAPSVASARRPRGLSTARTRVLPWRSSTMTDDDTALSHRIAAYRQAREQIERSLLPLATSVEGTRFTFQAPLHDLEIRRDRKSTRLNSSHVAISYAVFCLKKKTQQKEK